MSWHHDRTKKRKKQGDNVESASHCACVKADVCPQQAREEGTCATLVFAHSCDALCGVYLW